MHHGIADGLRIMLEGPIGAAAFNNEFGRPNILGYFRTLLVEHQSQAGLELRGYHKPIMIAGGVGVIRDESIEKKTLPEDTPLIVLGGPAFAIGLGGGSASSRTNQDANESIDYSSVQRANPDAATMPRGDKCLLDTR